MVLLSLRDCRQFPHVLIAWEEPTRPTAGWRSRTRGNRCGAWRAWVDRFVGPGTWRRAFEVRGGSQRPYAVVCARWCPTLPHPGGCSTIGAVRLSFRVRDGSGRVPVAVTTETSGWAVRCVDSVVWLACTRTHSHMRVRVWGWWWVGCGPYSGRFRAYRCSPRPTHRVVVGVGGGVVCVGLLVPVSSNRYRSSTSGLSTQ